MQCKTCRICNSNKLIKYLDLGFTPAADSFLREQGLQQPELTYPLEVCLCDDCGMSQLGYTVPPDVLYQHDYPYESSTTRAGRNHFMNFANKVVDRFGLGAKDLAVDIGSNVGVLLDGFRKNGCRILGVEPSANISAIAMGRGVDTINDFFGRKLAQRIVLEYGKASVITATNVFAHISGHDEFMESVVELLDERGSLIIEAPHFLKLLNGLEYDTIYHEHLLYISVRPLNSLFNRYGFEVYDVEEIGIHGGSIRIYVARTGVHNKTANVDKVVQEEEAAGAFDISRLRVFSDSVIAHRSSLLDLLRGLKSDGARLAGVSAPAKGMTLLNYCDIGSDLLDFVTEKSQLKIGLYTPGKHIPILSDEELTRSQPDYALLLAWNFADEIIENLSDYRERGGKFIIPIPEPRII